MAGWGRKFGLEREKLSLSLPPPHPFSSGRGGKGWDGKRAIPDSRLSPIPILEREGWDGYT